jgi:hypothetical protein
MLHNYIWSLPQKFPLGKAKILKMLNPTVPWRPRALGIPWFAIGYEIIICQGE